jgi:response regulator RpfG family c-di-GMP phosphodiesterase
MNKPPANATESATKVRNWPRLEGPPVEEERLLVVEDDPNIQRMISDYFRHVGYDVITASDGEVGVAAGDKRPADRYDP